MLSLQLPKHRRQLLDFGELDLTLKSIRVINRVPQSIRFISQLYLDGNHLLGLSGIEQFLNLEVFHFDYNYVTLSGELKKIKNAFFIKEISFIGNPIENNPSLKLQKLRNSGFSRLMIVNPPHSLSRRAPSQKEMLMDKQQMEEMSEIRHDRTERRLPTYGEECESTSRKRNVGKICSNNRFKTAKNNKKQQTLSRDTRQSTVRPQRHSPFGRNNRPDEQPITPFEEHTAVEQVQEQLQYDDLGALGSESATARFESSQNKQKLSDQFLQSQKELLADYFYSRTLMERSFDSLKQLKAQVTSVEGMQSEIINQHLENLRYSLIKLKYESSYRK